MQGKRGATYIYAGINKRTPAVIKMISEMIYIYMSSVAETSVVYTRFGSRATLPIVIRYYKGEIMNEQF
jgi:hypothetical protein